MTDQERYQQTLDKLNSVGPGFCLAKWNQVTIHLGTGLNHSCHHPGPHKISEAEVLRNPTHLHNTMYKKKCWKEMLEGKRPKECEYCWRIEDSSKEFSDRVFKSSEPWAAPTFDRIVNSYWMDDYYPTYVELSFSNRCNFKCLYCAPNFSSRWNEEAKKYGPVILPGVPPLNSPIDSKSEWRCQHIEENPLVQAFWKWWPELFRKVHSFRLTGGEPLLVKESYEIMDYMIEHIDEAENLKFFSINTNLGMSDEQFERFVQQYEKLAEKIPELVVFTSIESGKEESEYVRFGLDYNKFWYRVEELVKRIPRLTVSLMTTYNVLSVTSYMDTVKRAWDLKERYTTFHRVYGTPLMLDTSFLRHPSFLDIHTAPKHYRKYIEECADFIKDHFSNGFITIKVEKDGNSWTEDHPAPGFCEVEVEKAVRLLDYFDSNLSGYDVNLEREKLKVFLEEEDRRRNTNYRDIWKDESSLGL